MRPEAAEHGLAVIADELLSSDIHKIQYVEASSVCINKVDQRETTKRGYKLSMQIVTQIKPSPTNRRTILDLRYRCKLQIIQKNKQIHTHINTYVLF